ncbi:arylsulfatase [Maribacter sp. ACAM166]|uniref:arylsulfatase n=1 Tax=Maribacter sp. ACAM166 TaxID=2508996 RepID=UPI0010FE22FC|nr:arylsulfatase [Maribacter sp. ACAM166]TLP80193.1 arylsulfatase [Maribacter sp. ACAM166]
MKINTMNLKKIYSVVPMFALLMIASCNEQKKETKTNEAIVSPNIIYILADDLGYGDLSSYGQKNFETPNIDRLASQGMLFTQHYSGSTVCAPSRSALMTGMHTGHTVVRGNEEIQPEGQYPIPEATYTIAEMFKTKGYTTGAFGKWGLGFPKSEGDPTNQGFDTFFGYNCQRLGHHYYPHHLWSNRDSITLKGNEGNKKGIYAPELIHEKTIQFIETNKDKPFFLYVASIIPHAELAAPEEVLKKYRGKYPPEKIYEGLDSGPEYRKGSYESQKESHAAFVAMISILDQQVGDIMDKVKELGLDKNTIIVFTSDNGPHQEGGADPDYFDSNGELKGYKRDLYEGGVRVPMIASWPGKIKPNTKTDHISAFWDVFPTLGNLIGADIPTDLDGISFLPTLLNAPQDQEEHDYLYWEFHEKGGRQAVRMGDWKGVKYNVLNDPNAPIELYNLIVDIKEEHDVAVDQPDIISTMKKILKEARTPSDVFTFGQDTYLGSE